MKRAKASAQNTVLPETKGPMNINEEQRWLHNPGFEIYRHLVAPVLAFVPGRIAYPGAMMFGTLLLRTDSKSRDKIMRNLEQFSLGGPTAEDRAAVAQEFYRLRCCEAMEDLTLLRGPSTLGKAVQIDGLEHLRESLSLGHGAMLCGAHFGSFKSALSLLGATGYPSTPLMRRPSSARPDASPLRRAVYWAKSYALLHNMRRPNIPVQSGDPRADITTATIAAKYLANNEIVYINLDATVLPSYRDRALSAKFLGKDALFLPGAISIAKVTGARVHVVLAYRSRNRRRQRIVISPAIDLKGSVGEGYQRCLSYVERAVTARPAHWEMWDLIPEHGTYFPQLK